MLVNDVTTLLTTNQSLIKHTGSDENICYTFPLVLGKYIGYLFFILAILFTFFVLFSKLFAKRARDVDANSKYQLPLNNKYKRNLDRYC